MTFPLDDTGKTEDIEGQFNREYDLMLERLNSRRAMICLFLAILEMVKQQVIRLTQKESFGEIHAKRDSAFDGFMTDEGQVARIEEEYKN